MLPRQCIVLALLVTATVSSAELSGQLAPSRPLPSGTQATSSGTAAPVDLTGVVLDGRNRSPIQRALVRLGNRSVLTDHDGIFHLPEVTSTSVSLQASKPGYYPAADGDSGAVRSYRLPAATPIELLLYPEAILSGTVTNSAGEGLSGLGVTAQKSTYDDNGHHWYPAGQAQTANDGGFRLTLPSGVYTLHLSQRGRIGGGTELVIPLSVPAKTSTITEAIHLLPGQESHLDLRPEIRPTYRVTVAIETEIKGYPTLTARTANGLTIPLSPMPLAGGRTEFRVALPRGTFTLFGSMRNQDGLAEAQTQVTVADHDVTGVALRFTRAATLPLVIDVDSSIASDNAKPPLPTQFGLSLQSTGEVPDGNIQTFGVNTGRNAPPSFSVADGVYRLHAQTGGQWYIASATCGGLDLLSQDLPISAALDGTEIRVRVANNTATLSGKVTLDGVPAAAWVYLVASTPSATPVLTVRANADGAFVRPYLPPGAYRVVALERKVAADFQSTETLNRYLDRLQTVTLSSGEQRTLTLSAVPDRELAQ